MAKNIYRKSIQDELLRSFDPHVHALTIIQEQHRMAHDGFMYHTSGKITGVANGASVEVFMRTGTIPVHFTRAQFTLGRGDIDINTYEDTTVSADGTPIVIFNTNRISTNTPEMDIFGGATIVTDGNQMHTLWAHPTGTGVGNAIGLSEVSNGEEWILKPATNYMVRLTNNSGASITFSYEFLFYETDYIK